MKKLNGLLKKEDKMEFIKCEELDTKDHSVVIVDIRDNSMYASGHIKGAVQKDSYGSIKAGNIGDARKTLSTLPKNKVIVTVCNMGITAQKASKILEEM